MLTYEDGERTRPFKVLRPTPVPPRIAGQQGLGGWVGPDGRFYHSPHWKHDAIAEALRATGNGPAAKWDIKRPLGWFKVASNGQVVARPDLVNQAQLDTLADMLMASPEGAFRSRLLEFLRSVQSLAYA
jgi:hypothetical protein